MNLHIPVIKVIGIGGSGSNTISRMVDSDIKKIELIAINTDAQALQRCRAPKKILIGKETTYGLGTGMNAELGRRAALESQQKILESLKGAEMVFLTCGLGGGTGSGGIPVIAELCRSLGVLTIGVVTKPFSFEGEERRRVAEKALEKLKGKIDSLILISNDKLLSLIDEKTTVSEAFLKCDEILAQAVQSITNLFLVRGIINIDFSSISSLLRNSGRAVFGMGRGRGETRSVKAAEQAVISPLLEFSFKKVNGILFTLLGRNITLNEVRQAAQVITQRADSKTKIICGAIEDKRLPIDEMRISLVATSSEDSLSG